MKLTEADAQTRSRRSSSSRGWMCVWIVALLLIPSGALACEGAAARVVSYTLDGHGWDDAFRGDFRRELSASLSDVGLSPCELSLLQDNVRPVAHVAVRELDAEQVEISVRDTLTDKAVTRRLSLGSFSQDSRALALAVASDELLRASWLELALPRSTAPPAQPPEPAVVIAVERDIDRATPRRTAVAIEAAVEQFGQGELHLGGDLVVDRWFSRPLGVSLALGLRKGQEVKSENGRIASTAVSGEVGLWWRALKRTHVELSAGLAMRVAQVGFAATAQGGATDGAGSGVIAVARGQLRAAVLLAGDVFELRFTAGAGVPVMSLAATDDDEVATGTGGYEVFGRVGPGVRF